MPNDYKETFMHNIRYLRRRFNLSKRRMAALLGVGIQIINKIEQNIWPSYIPVYVLLFIHRRFGVDPDSQLHRRLDEEGAPPARLLLP